MLKKLSAIFLIFLLSFHWYGYRFIIDHFQQKADHELEARLDASDYTESELIEIRTALNMPYQSSFTAFERCYGEITIDGVVHTFVKRKIENGVLVLKCIPNQGKQAIKSAGADFFRDNNGFGDQQNQKESTPLSKAFKNAFCDCENNSQDFDPAILSFAQPAIFTHIPDLCYVNIPVTEQPPDQVS